MNTDPFYLTLLRLPRAPLCVIACLSFFKVKINHDEQKNINKQSIYVHYNTSMGNAVVQLAEALRYKLGGRRIDSRWCHWIFSLT